MLKATFAALLALAPIAALADPAVIMYVPRSDRFIQRLYVQTGTTLDIALPPGESLPSNPIIGDPRWTMHSFPSGDRVHVVVKPSGKLLTPQLLTIPSSGDALHLILTAGANESTAYTIQFANPKAPARLATSPTPAPSPTPPPKVAVEGCVPPLDSAYALSGDKRIDVRSACDDGKHTYIVVGDDRDHVGALLYRVDTAGHQDQIVNGSFSPKDKTHPDQWVVDGVANHWALVTDTSRGHMRKEITHK